MLCMCFVYVLNLRLKHSNTYAGGFMDDRYLNWAKIDLAIVARFFVFAGSGFVVGGLWASEALRVLALCMNMRAEHSNASWEAV